jgi:hypothetical protein
VADFGISILLSAPTYTLTQIQLAQVYVDTQGKKLTIQGVLAERVPFMSVNASMNSLAS